MKHLIDKYIKRIKIDYPEDDKLMIDLEDFAKEITLDKIDILKSFMRWYNNKTEMYKGSIHDYEIEEFINKK